MDYLHAPWRDRYVTSSRESRGNVFAEIIAASDQDEANFVLHRDRTCLAVLNKFPYSTAHALIVPYKATPQLEDLLPDELRDVMVLSQRLVAAIRAEFAPDAFNVGFNLGEAAGAGIADHLHLHVVPRWRGDHNFMTVLAATRVVPHECETVWKRLRPHFADGASD